MIRGLVVAAALALAAPAAAQAQAEGEFFKAVGDPVYRLVGGAPLHIGSCDTPELNRCSPLVQRASLDGLRQYPADGATVRNHEDQGIYVFAGGAPMWRSVCPNDCRPFWPVDSVSIADSAHMRELPVDGTVVRNISDGGTYRFAGGAPLLVRCDLECPNPPQVDNGTFAELGFKGARNTMRQYPAAGTTVLDTDTGRFYRFAGGYALPLSACDGCAAVPVDSRTFERLGTGTPSMPHMVAAPPDHFFLTTGAATYRLAGGSAVQVTDCGPLGGCQNAVAVDAGTIASLSPTPRDGTVLRGLPSGRTWEFVGGKRRETFIARLDAVEVDDGAIALLPADTPAPPPPPAPAPFAPVISSGYKVYRSYTRFTSLKVRGAPAGSVVTVQCKGKGCPFKKAKQHRLGGSSIDIRARWFKRAKLRNRASVLVRVSGPAGERKQMEFRIRSRKLPVRTTRCSAAGAKLSRCA